MARFRGHKASHSRSSPSGVGDDVFLSFRGEDTRKNFTDHLYTALVNAHFRTFRDEPELERGENIKEKLENAIRQSWSSVIVFSKDYTSSRWCLDELVFILERKRSSKHVVLPVFYDVDPSQLRKQAETLSKHPKYQENQSPEKLSRWKEALKEVADLAGMVLKNEADGHESKFIQNIVREIQKKLDHLGDSLSATADREIQKKLYHLGDSLSATADHNSSWLSPSGDFVCRQEIPIEIEIGVTISTVSTVTINPEAFEAAIRKAILEVMKKGLKDDGMGNIGKTTMVNHVAAQSRESRNFDFVMTGVVSQSPDLTKIQGTLAGPSGCCTGKPKLTVTNWEKGDYLGSGSFGSVYKGITDGGCFIAVKEVPLLDQGRVSQLEQEIALLSQFEHENIVQYYGTQKDESKLYIFLELVTEGSLRKQYQTYDLTDSYVSLYTRQILQGLKYLHDQNVIHRDIKCANILVHANGSVKLADFGLAKAIKMNDIISPKGTPKWMAPEVVHPKSPGYGLPADIWSLGCTVLEMLTRDVPYPNLEWFAAGCKIMMGEPPLVPDSLSREAQDFIHRCLQVKPDNRPTAAQLLEHPFVPPTSSESVSPYNHHRQS